MRSSVERALKLGPVVVPLFLAVVALGLDFALAKPGHTAEFVQFVGRFHPLVVHLPIGFLLLVAFAEALTLVPRWRSRIDPALALLWPALAASAVLAFALGLLLAHDGGYPDHLVTLHRRLTLAAVLAIALSAALWPRVEQGRLPRVAYRGVLVAALGLLSLGAHQGGSLSRGENYLFELAPSFVRDLLHLQPPPAPAAAPKKAEPNAEPLVFASVVAPIFRERCLSCHGAEKQKGGLRLDSFENLKKGGKNGPEVAPGDSAHSRLVNRLTLPLADDERMPPEDKPQPTPGEVEIIKWWIDRGANDTLRVRDTLAPDAARALLIHSAVASGVTGLGIASPGTPATDPAGPSASPASASSPAPPTAPNAASAAPEHDASAPTADQRALFPAVIAPLLASRCGKCHGAEKQKGHLRTDSQAALITGGKNGHGVVPGDPAHGTVLARLALPTSDDAHMPPAEEPQLTSSQISLLKWWVGAGANSETAVTAAPPALVASARNLRAASHAAAPSATSPASEAAASTPPNVTATTPQAPLDPAVLASLPPTIRLYQDIVKPMLANRCGDCHGGNDPDGDLRIDDYQHLLASKAVVPGKPKQSELVVRTRLPAGKSRHMPPAVSSQPEPAELDALELWIAQGATEDATVQAASLPVSVAGLVQHMLPSAKAAAPTAVAAVPVAPAPAPSETAKSPTNTEVLASLTPPRGGCAACAVSLQERNSPLPIALALLAGSTFLLRRRA